MRMRLARATGNGRRHRGWARLERGAFLSAPWGGGGKGKCALFALADGCRLEVGIASASGGGAFVSVQYVRTSSSLSVGPPRCSA